MRLLADVSQIIDGAWMQTFTGKPFSFFDVKPGSIMIEDIAHALSLKCRYNGHCIKFYSVAQHSVLMSRAMPWHSHTEITTDISLMDKRAALFHDVSETYLPDVPSPLKKFLQIWTPTGMKSLREFEKSLLQDIIRALDLRPVAIGPTTEWWDLIMLATERRDLMVKSEKEWGHLPDPIPPEDLTIDPWSPARAHEEFLKEFDNLFVVKDLTCAR